MPAEPGSIPRPGRLCFRSRCTDQGANTLSREKIHKKAGGGNAPPARASCRWRPCRRRPCQSASRPLLPCFRPRPVPARGRDRCGQHVTLPPLSVPVTPLPLSFPRGFQVPFLPSPARPPVAVLHLLFVLPPRRVCHLHTPA